MRFALSKEDSLTEIISILSHNLNARIHNLKLANIKKYFSVLNSTNILESREILEYAIEKMESLVKTRNYIHAVGLRQCISLNQKVLSKIIEKTQKVNSFLIDFYAHCINTKQFEQFHHRFVSLYGCNVRVPIHKCLTILKSINLADSPKIYTNPLTKVPSDPIHLEDCYYFTNNVNRNIAFSSELNLQISIDEHGQYNMEISPASGSSFAGKMIGRFSKAFSSVKRNEYKTIMDNNLKIARQIGVKLYKIESLFSDPVLYNVRNKDANNYEKVYLSNFDTWNVYPSTNDHYIHVDHNNNFVVTDSQGNVVHYVEDSMLNPQKESVFLSFIMGIHHEASAVSAINYLKKIYAHDLYNPELKLYDVTILPETWRYSSDSDLKFENFIKQFNVPDIVYFTIGDNRLLLNLNNKEDVNIIRKAVKKMNYIELQKPNLILSECIKKQLSFDISELVFSFFDFDRKARESKLESLPVYTESNIRIQGFGSSWIYIKLYIPEERQKDFIVRYLSKFFDYVKKQFGIKNIFYIRYCDETSHIRLRIQSKTMNDKNQISSFLIKYLEQLQHDEIITNYSSDIYERELERYGGENNISTIEQLFTINSELSISLLVKNQHNGFENLKYDVVLSCYLMLKALGFTDSNIVSIFVNTDRNREKNFFHKNKHSFLYDTEHIEKVFSKPIIETILDQDRLLLVLSTQLKNEELIRIMHSLIHMFCNRVFGINRAVEKDVKADMERLAYAKVGFNHQNS